MKLICRWMEEDGGTLEELVAKAVKEYDRVRFFRLVDEGYKRLQADPVAWQQELEERKLFEGTLMDDLWDDPYPLEELEEAVRSNA